MAVTEAVKLNPVEDPHFYIGDPEAMYRIFAEDMSQETMRVPTEPTVLTDTEKVIDRDGKTWQSFALTPERAVGNLAKRGLFLDEAAGVWTTQLDELDFFEITKLGLDVIQREVNKILVDPGVVDMVSYSIALADVEVATSGVSRMPGGVQHAVAFRDRFVEEVDWQPYAYDDGMKLGTTRITIATGLDSETGEQRILMPDGKELTAYMTGQPIQFSPQD